MKAMSSTSLLLAYYGDDFTGSTDVMESLSRAGLKTVLFLKPPTEMQLARFTGLRAFGVAGGSRMMSPRQMECELLAAFKALKTSGAAFIHYKTCSTFDSSPTVGSIGKAIELGRRVFGERITPLVVGTPVLGRYVVFGNLFARSGLDTEPSRLDRHPTMSRHPVTPMDEADLRLHLGRQTELPVELVDVLKLDAGRSRRRGYKAGAGLQEALMGMAERELPPIVLFDTLLDSDLAVIGRLISSQRPPGGQLFCAGSSGVEYALVAYWRESGKAGQIPTPVRRTKSAVSQIITISGSCSPVTDRQIERAVKDGFVEVSCDTGLLADPKTVKQAVADALARARPAFGAGRNIIFQTARGAADWRRAQFERVIKRFPGRTRAERAAAAGETLGRGLAVVLEQTLLKTGAKRAIVCGGDTSTAVARALGVEALQFVSAAAPGAPLCRIVAPHRVAHGCEVVFKGGQVGRDSFFSDLVSEDG